MLVMMIMTMVMMNPLQPKIDISRERKRANWSFSNQVIELDDDDDDDDDEVSPYGTTAATRANITSEPESDSKSVRKGKGKAFF